MPKLCLDDSIEASFTPYVTALGRVAHAWNHLQEHLAQLFCLVSGINDAMGLAIWHALKSDRSQRDILEAAVNVASSDPDWIETTPHAKADLLWLLKKANKVAEQRNNAIHAPCGLSIDEGEFEIIPETWYQNPRAGKLRGTDVLREFDWYEKSADTLMQFARAIYTALNHGACDPWPERPPSSR
jgi:hypothetical protein